MAVAVTRTIGASPSGRKPTRQQAILKVLNEKPWLTIKNLSDEVITRGWGPKSDTPQGVIRTVASRMFREGKLARKENADGILVFAVAPVEEQSKTSDAPGNPRASDLPSIREASIGPT